MPALVQEGFAAGLRTPARDRGDWHLKIHLHAGRLCSWGARAGWAYTLARVLLILIAAAAIVAGLFVKPIWRQGERAATEAYLLIAFGLCRVTRCGVLIYI